VLEVRPQPSGLGRLRGRVWTRRGSVEVGWSVETERFVLDLGLSEPGQTHLGVPRLGRRFPTVSVNGETLWRNEKFYPNSFVRKVEAGEEEIGLELQDSGWFEVVVE
jgi:hypothetical protein